MMSDEVSGLPHRLMHNNHVKADLTGLIADPASIKHGSPTVHAAVRITRGPARCTYSTGRLFACIGRMRRHHGELIDIQPPGARSRRQETTPIGLTAPAWTFDRGFGDCSELARTSLTLRHQIKPPGARVVGAPCQRGAGDVASNIACRCASDVDLLRDLNGLYIWYGPAACRNENRRDGFGSR